MLMLQHNEESLHPTRFISCHHCVKILGSNTLGAYIANMASIRCSASEEDLKICKKGSEFFFKKVSE